MEGPTEIVPGVYGLGSEKVNWYLVEHEGRLTAVDAGLPAFATTLAADLAKIGKQIADVDAVVLTHSDGDHTGLANTFQQQAGARVLVHGDDDAALRKPGVKGGDANPRNILPLLVRPNVWSLIWHMARRGAAKPPPVQGAELYTGGDVLADVPGKPRVIATPGHTPGHCALLFEEHGALFVGDAMCTWNLVTGSTGPQLMPLAFNFDTAQSLASLAAIEPLEAAVLLPGHGEPWREGPAAAVARARGLAASA